MVPDADPVGLSSQHKRELAVCARRRAAVRRHSLGCNTIANYFFIFNLKNSHSHSPTTPNGCVAKLQVCYRAAKLKGHKIGRSAYLLKTQWVIFTGTFQGGKTARNSCCRLCSVNRTQIVTVKDTSAHITKTNSLLSSPYNLRFIAPPTWFCTSALLLLINRDIFIPNREIGRFS